MKLEIVKRLLSSNQITLEEAVCLLETTTINNINYQPHPTYQIPTPFKPFYEVFVTTSANILDEYHGNS